MREERRMTVCSTPLLLMWLLQVTANNAEATILDHSSPAEMAGTVTGTPTDGQMKTRNASSSFPKDLYSVMPSITAKTNSRNDQTVTGPTNSTLPQLKPSVKEGTMKTITQEPTQSRRRTATGAVTNLTIKPTTGTIVPPILNNSMQEQNTSKTTSSQLPSHTKRQASTRPALSTHRTSTTITGTKLASPVPIQTTVTSSSTTVKKNPFREIKKTGKVLQQKERPNHGRIAAGLMGGALMVMIIGFLVIFFKKRMLQKQQITTTDWAGPSPFLDSVAENAVINQMSSNQISLGGVLPQRLSKRLSEWQDMTGDTTFTDKYEGIIFGQDEQASNGPAAGIPGSNSTGDDKEDAVSVTFAQSNNAVSRNADSEAAGPGQNHALV
ncbi:protein EVI2B isoform X2 [Betta splendens]|nr:protein EVI2B isoform X2 [Betta splendens]